MIGARIKNCADEEWARRKQSWKWQAERKVRDLEIQIEMLQRELNIARMNLAALMPNSSEVA